MGIVSAKPPYRHGIRRILTAEELGITLPKKQEEVKPEAPKVEEPVKVEEPAIKEPETVQEPAEINEPAAQVEEPKAEEPEKPVEEKKEEEKVQSLRDLGFSKISRNRLKANGIETLEALQDYINSGKQLSELNGLDEKALKTLEEEIAAIQNK